MTDKLTPYILADNSDHVSYISRLDFVKNTDGCYKLVEINSDTPCALPETFYANKVAEAYLLRSTACICSRVRMVRSWQSHFKAVEQPNMQIRM